MTTALDRLIAAIDDESPVPRQAQLELVQQLLGRRHRDRNLSLPSGPVSAAEQPLCPTCITPYDPDGFCGTCGGLLTAIDRRSRPIPSGGAASGRRRPV